MEPTGVVFIRGPELRKRWGAMPCSTFYERLKRGVIPKPEYPFGPDTPYWRLDEIEAHERKGIEVANHGSQKTTGESSE